MRQRRHLVGIISNYSYVTTVSYKKKKDKIRSFSDNFDIFFPLF